MSPSISQPEAKPSLLACVLCTLLAVITFPLIWVGGLVTTYDAGMAVPDWPGTYGYNMFLYPWQTWVSGPWDLFIEHGHRLLGSLAGLVAISLVVASFAFAAPRWQRVAAVAALLLVIVQGALGGARVLLDERMVAALHGCVGPAFFAYVCTLAWWLNSARVNPCPATISLTKRGTIVLDNSSDLVSAMTAAKIGRQVLGAVLPLTIAVSLQMIVGALVRHVPVTASAQYFRAAILVHVVLGMLIAVQAMGTGWKVLRSSASARFGRAAILVATIVLLQVGLGIGTYIVKYSFPTILLSDSTIGSVSSSTERAVAGYTVVEKSFAQAMITTAHVANGSLLLAASVLFTSLATRDAWTARSLFSASNSPADRNDTTNASPLAISSQRGATT